MAGESRRSHFQLDFPAGPLYRTMSRPMRPYRKDFKEIEMANFLLLLHQAPTSFRNLSPEEMQKILGSYIAWREGLVKRNKMRGGEKLTDDGGRHLRTQSGKVS